MPGVHRMQLQQCACSSHTPLRRPAALPRGRLGASLQPAIVLTSTGEEVDSVQQLAAQIRRQLPCEAVVVTPPVTTGSSSCQRRADELRFDAPLALTPQRHQQYAYTLAGASAAECVMCAADHKGGLLAALGLAPVLVVVGVQRGPALASGVDVNPAVTTARLSAQLLGLPALAACLATTSAAAPCQPALDATLQLLHHALALLQHVPGSSWPRPANSPRAHYPFPEAGRWALGKSLPLPHTAAGARGAGGGLSGADCWALGEDNAWHTRAGGSGGAARRDAADARQLLRRAFAEGDLLLALNVPPTWQGASGRSSGSAPFAATRPGVLWPCHQVEAAAAAGRGDASAAARSWATDGADLYGRSLPSSSYGGSGGERLAAGAFVAQDNTASVMAAAAAAAGRGAGGVTQQLPASFTLRRGTLLSDHATAGDVDAVFSGRAAVTALQTWPAGHPLSVTDELLAAALDEQQDGLPAWLAVEG